MKQTAGANIPTTELFKKALKQTAGANIPTTELFKTALKQTAGANIPTTELFKTALKQLLITVTRLLASTEKFLTLLLVDGIAESLCQMKIQATSKVRNQNL